MIALREGDRRDVGDVARAGLRRALRTASRVPVAPLTLAGLRTGAFLARSLASGRVVGAAPVPDAPEPRLSPAVAAQVALDEAVLAVMNNPSRVPEAEELLRVGEEVRAARELSEGRGWLADPRSFHPDPPPLDRPGVARSRGPGPRYERLLFESGYEPRPGEPGRERWLAHEANRTAHAWILRHRDGPRPWLVCLPGFGTGRPLVDLYAFRAAHLHERLGVDVAIPVLPMHGPRSPGPFSGAAFMSHDLMNVVHGMAQSIWDTRRVVRWIRREQDPTRIGVYGVSLGGYLASLLAGLEDDLDAAIAGVPICDLPELFRHHAPERFLRRRDARALLGEDAEEVLRVVSPLAVEPLVDPERRYLFAGLLDRMAPPSQALRLWEHWGRCPVAWYGGNHVGFRWSRRVDEFVLGALETSLC